MNIKFKSFYGNFMILVGLIVGFSLIIIPFYNEYNYFLAFFLPASGSILLGILFNIFDKDNRNFNTSRINMINESSTKVIFAWIYGAIIAALPFIICNMLNPIQALFESVSGFTTTGLSVVDVTIAPKVILFHRSFMQYCGGLGFIMMMLLISTNKKSMELYHAEAHSDRLLPHLKKTARVIFYMYALFLLIGTLAYMFFGMNLFESICHCMCSLSTGGFSTRLNSIGEYNSIGIRLVTVVLMIIGTTNFAVLLCIVRGKFKKAFRVSEMKFLGFLLILSVPIVGFSLMATNNLGFVNAMYESLVNVSSAISTTGYSTMNFADWSEFVIGVIIILMIIGGGIGSTAGGLKLSRVYLLFRIMLINIKRQLSPKQRISTEYYMTVKGRTKIDDEVRENTCGFFLIYMFIFIILSLMVSISAKTNLTKAMFEISSALSTVGLSIGITNPNTDMYTLIIEIIAMILGRLEIFTIIIASSCALRKIGKIGSR